MPFLLLYVFFKFIVRCEHYVKFDLCLRDHINANIMFVHMLMLAHSLSLPLLQPLEMREILFIATKLSNRHLSNSFQLRIILDFIMRLYQSTFIRNRFYQFHIQLSLNVSKKQNATGKKYRLNRDHY